MERIVTDFLKKLVLLLLLLLDAIGFDVNVVVTPVPAVTEKGHGRPAVEKDSTDINPMDATRKRDSRVDGFAIMY